MEKPILITGPHRSGTTFIGKILRSAPGVGYVQEPFNPDFGIRGIDDWYIYIRPGMPQENEYIRLMEKLLKGTARYKTRRGTHGGLLRTVGRKLLGSNDYLQYLKATRLPWEKRLLIKDPISSLSSKWLHDRFQMKVVAMIRHPGSFAASNARLGWKWFFFDRLTKQTELMEDYLGEIIGPLKPQELPFHERSALFWRCIVTVLDDYSEKCSNFRIVRLEDVSMNPQEEFRKLFDFLELEFSEGTKTLIRETTGADNPVEAPKGRVHSLRRNSQELSSSWKKAISDEELAAIMRLAGPPAAKYYNTTNSI